GAITGVKAAHHGTDLTESRTFLGNGDVTNDLQDIPTAHREAVHASNDRLLKFVDGFVHLHRGYDTFKHQVVRQTIFAPAKTKKTVTSAGNDDDTCTCLAADFIDQIPDLESHGRGKHIAIVGPIQS